MFSFTKTCHRFFGIMISTRTMSSKSIKIRHLDIDVPSYVDWREKGSVGPVLYQGEMNFCWAFASVACLEAFNHQRTGMFIKLSEQQLIDGAKKLKCGSGFTSEAFNFVIKNRGLAAEKDYLWTGIVSQFRKTQVVYGEIHDYACIHRNDELELLVAVAKQPVVVLVDASSRSFGTYAQGIYREPFLIKQMNHFIVVVGYGSTEDGEDYWICKNSWGSNWGEAGYMRIKRNIKFQKDYCNIAYQAMYPMRKDITPPFKRPFRPPIICEPCKCSICRPDLKVTKNIN